MRKRSCLAVSFSTPVCKKSAPMEVRWISADNGGNAVRLASAHLLSEGKILPLARVPLSQPSPSGGLKLGHTSMGINPFEFNGAAHA